MVTTIKHNVDAIKAQISCQDYMVREHNSHIRGNRCVSFRPGATNPSSLLVYERDWYDFGSSRGGDVIDMCAEDKFNGNKGQAIRHLAQMCHLDGIAEIPEIDVKFNRYSSLLDDAVTYCAERLQQNKEQLDYLHQRGLRDDYIKAKRLGYVEVSAEYESIASYLKGKGYTIEEIRESGILQYTKHIIIPYLKNGKAVYLIGRDRSGNPNAPKYMKLHRPENGFSDHPVWGMESLYRKWNGEKVEKDSPVIVAEGAFDAMSCEQEGYSVVSAITGAFSAEQRKDLFPALLGNGRKVVICMDYDPETQAGQAFTEKLAHDFFMCGGKSYPHFLVGGNEKVDISELYAKAPRRETLDEIFESANDDYGKYFISRHCNSASQIDELKAFLRECRDRLSAEQREELAVSAQEVLVISVSKSRMRMLLRILVCPPSAREVYKDFLEKYDLLYKPKYGWFEWNKKNPTVWRMIDEDIVKSYVHDACGQFVSKQLQDGVFALVKTDPNIVCGDDFQFNRNRDIFVFKNGTFNLATLDPKDFVAEHRREDFCTTMVDYDYNPEADYPNWDKAVMEITDEDEKRYFLLQEMFGYCLTFKNDMQKCFCLIGDGANGKSVVLSTLESLIGRDSCSHVEIAFLDKEFQRIRLLNSKVNVCNDMKSDVAGSDSWLKAIVSGDTINACYKGKDFIDFNPMCKMVFATNIIPSFRESVYGLLRRFSFIKFPVRFTDCPDESKGERKIDRQLIEKLLPELSGIFNWAVVGLRSLRENGMFSEPLEDRDYKNEMILQSNPVIEWAEHFDDWRECHVDQVFARKDVYHDYANYCNDNGQKAESPRSFWRHLRQIRKLQDCTKGKNTRCVRFTN